jgi:uncharacterized membrane protein YGL010W
MALRENLIAWQWDGYPEYHRDRLNLIIHLLAVPAFIVGTLGVVTELALGRWLYAAGAAGVMAVGFAAQAVGHGREASPAIPFAGAGDAISRIFTEQFINFPRYLASGRWLAALRG